MQLNRQTADNYGTIKLAYMGEAKDYTALVAANGGATTGFDQNTIDTYLYKVEHEFEKADWRETTQNSDQGSSVLYEVFMKFRQMNQAVRTWRKFWFEKEIIVLIFDYQGNEMLIGSNLEPMEFSGNKQNVQRVTDGSFYDVVLSAQMRYPI